MNTRRYTGLAGTAVVLAEKVQATEQTVKTMGDSLCRAGEDYADAWQQTERIRKAITDLADLCLDLAALVLKADRVQVLALAGEDEQGQDHPSQGPSNGQAKK